MAMRMTGMMSGMDTESIIQELVAAKRTKVDDVKKKQTKLEWKQDAWKELNTKLKNLQSKYVSNMRFSTAYMKKTTKVSQGGFPGAVFSQQRMDLALFELQGNVIIGDNSRKPLCDVQHLYCIRCVQAFALPSACGPVCPGCGVRPQ